MITNLRASETEAKNDLNNLEGQLILEAKRALKEKLFGNFFILFGSGYAGLGINLNILTVSYASKIFFKRIDAGIEVSKKIQNAFSIASQKETESYPTEINGWDELVLFCKEKGVSLEKKEKDQGVSFLSYRKLEKSDIMNHRGYLLIFSVNKVLKSIKGKIIVIDSKEIKKLNRETAERNYSFITKSGGSVPE